MGKLAALFKKTTIRTGQDTQNEGGEIDTELYGEDVEKYETGYDEKSVFGGMISLIIYVFMAVYVNYKFTQVLQLNSETTIDTNYQQLEDLIKNKVNLN